MHSLADISGGCLAGGLVSTNSPSKACGSDFTFLTILMKNRNQRPSPEFSDNWNEAERADPFAAFEQREILYQKYELLFGP